MLLFPPPAPTRPTVVWQGENLRIIESDWVSLDTSGPEFKHAYRRTSQRSPFGLAQGRYRLVALNEANEAVGMAEAVRRFRGQQPGLVLSYAVRPDWFGWGIGTLCTAHTVIGALQRFHDVDVIWAEIYPDNKASARLAARLGMRVEPATEEGDLAVFCVDADLGLLLSSIAVKAAETAQERGEPEVVGVDNPEPCRARG